MNGAHTLGQPSYLSYLISCIFVSWLLTTLVCVEIARCCEAIIAQDGRDQEEVRVLLPCFIFVRRSFDSLSYLSPLSRFFFSPTYPPCTFIHPFPLPFSSFPHHLAADPGIAHPAPPPPTTAKAAPSSPNSHPRPPALGPRRRPTRPWACPDRGSRPGVGSRLRCRRAWRAWAG